MNESICIIKNSSFKKEYIAVFIVLKCKLELLLLLKVILVAGSEVRLNLFQMLPTRSCTQLHTLTTPLTFGLLKMLQLLSLLS